MTILLVILTFAIFITADALLTKRRVAAAAKSAPSPAPTASEPVWVAGYQLPDGLYYHRGHTWARPEGDTVVVGLDDFARRLLGRRPRRPAARDRRLAPQGEVAFGVGENGRTADLVAPVEGEVVAVNRDLSRQPSLAADDPFGRGWVLKVRAVQPGREPSQPPLRQPGPPVDGGQPRGARPAAHGPFRLGAPGRGRAGGRLRAPRAGRGLAAPGPRVPADLSGLRRRRTS